MFYYLIYNSALGNYQEYSKRYLTTFLYGSILYLVIHAYLYSSGNSFHQQLRFYFWIIWLIDSISIGYISNYLEPPSENQGEEIEGSTLKSLLGKLKNKITNNETLTIKNDQSIPQQNNNHNNQSDNNQPDPRDELDSFLDDFGSTLIDKSIIPTNPDDQVDLNNKEINGRSLIYNPNEFNDLNGDDNNDRSTSMSPVFSDIGSEGSGSEDIDLDDFEASLAN